MCYYALCVALRAHYFFYSNDYNYIMESSMMDVFVAIELMNRYPRRGRCYYSLVLVFFYINDKNNTRKEHFKNI